MILVERSDQSGIIPFYFFRKLYAKNRVVVYFQGYPETSLIYAPINSFFIFLFVLSSVVNDPSLRVSGFLIDAAFLIYLVVRFKKIKFKKIKIDEYTKFSKVKGIFFADISGVITNILFFLSVLMIRSNENLRNFIFLFSVFIILIYSFISFCFFFRNTPVIVSKT